MNVLKFGGSSVETPENIELVLGILSNATQPYIVVVSAFGGVTDQLIAIGQKAASGDDSFRNDFQNIVNRHLATVKALVPIDQQSSVLSAVQQSLNTLETLYEGTYLLNELSAKTEAIVSGYGELLSYFIIGHAAKAKGISIELCDTRKLIETAFKEGKVVVNFERTNNKIQSFFKNQNKNNFIVPGFVAADEKGVSTTLGRGGSDYTASIIAAALKAQKLEIWTDVSGMFTANPSLVRQAISIDQISYQEAMELSHFGAKVLYAPTVQPVMKQDVEVLIKNTFKPEDRGTQIGNFPPNSQVVKGITHINNIALLTLEGSGMVGFPGYSKRLMEVLSDLNINIVMITQASSEQSICVGIDESDAQRAQKGIEEAFEYEISLGRLNPVSIEKDLAILALVGDNMKNHQGISGKMFSTLGYNNVNVKAIAQGASERNITAVIDKKDVKKALNVLHERFFETQIKQLNLFVTGVGNVGSKLLEQIQQQRDYLCEELRLNLRVIGICNSRKMTFNHKGIDLSDWQKLLENGEKSSPEDFIAKTKEMNMRNSIFVDNTASEKIAQTYDQYLQNNIGVVTCNKIAAADNLGHYKKLKNLSKTFGVPFLFETNVGAGLPIIDTLNNLIASGDKVRSIQAVLSGSLNFVFNNFNNENSFHDVVLEAQEKGYTEPDPKIDLSGVDVARKILILAREAGYELELSDIKNESFLPKSCLETQDNDSFFESLKENAQHFNEIYAQAAAKNCRLKYVASFEDGRASVGLQHIPVGHDFYNLEGSDNIVLFSTDRYAAQPLIVKGAGAGAEVTASGIFADIIRIGKK